MRQVGSDDIFFGGAPLSSPVFGGDLQITSQVPFSQIDPDQLRREAAAQIARLEQRLRG